LLHIFHFTFTVHRLVDHLSEAGIRVVDIACGAWHTVALTDEVCREGGNFLLGLGWIKYGNGNLFPNGDYLMWTPSNPYLVGTGETYHRLKFPVTNESGIFKNNHSISMPYWTSSKMSLISYCVCSNIILSIKLPPCIFLSLLPHPQGDLYGWGWNEEGQLGYPKRDFYIQPLPYPFELGDERVS
jgi:hypothetical protein